jgi:hypoxanthine phosphoribosyltransferase
MEQENLEASDGVDNGPGDSPLYWQGHVGPVLLSESMIKTRVAELGRQISADYARIASEFVIIGILTGSFIFLADLVRKITHPLRIYFARAKSYAGIHSTGSVWLHDFELLDVRDKHVLIVEDIVDTGKTLKAIAEELGRRGALSVQFCAFISKQTDRKDEGVPEVRYVGFVCPDRFVVGYGLDCDERFRQLPFVGVYHS